VLAAEAQEGGVNRNSSPHVIEGYRAVYDKFLKRYPLFFGFWKKYADLEFAIAGTEAAEMVRHHPPNGSACSRPLIRRQVYERAVASIGSSVDLWANYCTFKSDTSHDVDVIRE
jgi:pre-mRNA-processing factor 39